MGRRILDLDALADSGRLDAAAEAADCDSLTRLGSCETRQPQNREKGRPGHQRRSRRQRELVELLSRPSQKRARDRFDHVEFLQCDRDLRRVSSGSAQQI
jgi:hypothetical protein